MSMVSLNPQGLTCGQTSLCFPQWKVDLHGVEWTLSYWTKGLLSTGALWDLVISAVSDGESYLMYLCKSVSTPCSVVDLFKCLHSILLTGTGSLSYQISCHQLFRHSPFGWWQSERVAGTGIPLGESMAMNQSMALWFRYSVVRLPQYLRSIWRSSGLVNHEADRLRGKIECKDSNPRLMSLKFTISVDGKLKK